MFAIGFKSANYAQVEIGFEKISAALLMSPPIILRKYATTPHPCTIPASHAHLTLKTKK